MIGQFLFGEPFVPVQYGSQIFIPAVVFPLKERQKDLLPGFEIVIDRGP